MRTKIGWRQYNPSKPAKYGMLFKSINPAALPFTLQTAVYAGKPKSDTPSPHYISGVLPIMQSLVSSLLPKLSLKGANISVDRLYTSVDWAEWALTKNITTVGTLNTNRRGIPKEILDIKQRDDKSYIVMYDKGDRNKSLHSYVVESKSTNKKKHVLLLTTHPFVHGVTKDDGHKKPQIMKYYDFTKGGTDIIDQRMGSLTCKSKSAKWTITAFSYLLDTMRVNSQTIYALNHEKNPRSVSSPLYLWDLVLELATPHMLRRLQTPGVQDSIKQVIRSLCAIQPVELPAIRPDEVGPSTVDTARRCRNCVDEAKTDPDGYKKAKNRISKVTTVCMACSEHLCKKHMISLCTDCFRGQKNAETAD